MNPTSGSGGGFSATSRQEFIADIQLSSLNTQYQLPTNGGLIPNDRFMFDMLLTYEGRFTNPGSTGPSSVLADAPFSLIESVQIQGYHRVRAASEPFINVRGVDLYNLMRIYQGQIPYVVPNSAGAPLFTVSLTTANNGTNDIRFTLLVPFTPLRIPIGSQLGWLLDAPNYDQLKLTVQYADSASLFVNGASLPTQSAFGSTTGNPRIRTDAHFALGGSSVYAYVPGRVWRYFFENTSGDILNTVTASRQYNIPRGYRVRGILVKTGVKATTVTAGNNAYTSYSDTIFANIKVQRGLNKTIRYYEDYYRIKIEDSHLYGMYPAVGYALIDWAPRGTLREVLNTVGMVAGPSGDTDLYVQADITGGSNQASLFLLEELRGLPAKLGSSPATSSTAASVS